VGDGVGKLRVPAPDRSQRDELEGSRSQTRHNDCVYAAASGQVEDVDVVSCRT